MPKYFNIDFEFNKDEIDQTIERCIERKEVAYVCSVDGNNLVSANKNPLHLKALNGAIVNLCDSAWTPLLINCIYKTKYKNYTGADLFLEFIKKRKYTQFFLGSTPDILQGLKLELTKIDAYIAQMRFETLPFRKVEDFDYPAIAKMINEDKPDIIWVSLGAPKQELFMYNLKPYLKCGVMFGFGAIFNFNSGLEGQRRAPKAFIQLRMEWLYRIFQDPKRLLKRYWGVFLSYPGLVTKEIRRKKMSSTLLDDI